MQSPRWLQPQIQESLEGKARRTWNSHPKSTQEAALPTKTPLALSSRWPSCSVPVAPGKLLRMDWALSPHPKTCLTPGRAGLLLGLQHACLHHPPPVLLSTGRDIRITYPLQTFSKAGSSQYSSKFISPLTRGVLFQASAKPEAPCTQGAPWKRLLWKPHMLNTSADTMVLHSVRNDWFFWALISEAALSTLAVLR